MAAALRVKLNVTACHVTSGVWDRRIVDRLLTLLTDDELSRIFFRWFDLPRPAETVHLPANIE